jgi:hypothetical protein
MPAANPVKHAAVLVASGGADPTADTLPPASGYIARC